MILFPGDLCARRLSSLILVIVLFNGFQSLTEIPHYVFYKMVFSLDFCIDRGCRQGDATSPYIFNLCIEIMGHLIRQDRNIKRIEIGKETVCLLQFADDTVISLEGYEKRP